MKTSHASPSKQGHCFSQQTATTVAEVSFQLLKGNGRISIATLLCRLFVGFAVPWRNVVPYFLLQTQGQSVSIEKMAHGGPSP